MADENANHIGGKPGNPNWKKGVSGNPEGRPRTGLAVSELFRNFLEDVDPGRKVPRIEALASKLYDMQMDGNVAAGRALLEWGVPKPPQRVDVTSDTFGKWAEAFDNLR